MESLFPGNLFTNIEHTTFEAQTIMNGSQRNEWKSKKWKLMICGFQGVRKISAARNTYRHGWNIQPIQKKT